MNLFSRLTATRRAEVPATLRIAGQDVPLAIARNAAAKRISIRLCAASRTVKLTMPARASLREALAFAARNTAWLEAQIARRWPNPLPFEPGAVVPFGDATLRLEPIPSRRTQRIGDRLLVNDDPLLFTARTTRWLKAEAQRQLETETRALAARIGHPVAAVRVGDPASRWGSCASGRNTAGGRIAYSWRLIMAPDFVRHSVVAHEVAHLAEPNHSPAFWQVATDLLGCSHAPARAWLAEHGPLLHAQGAVRGGRQCHEFRAGDDGDYASAQLYRHPPVVAGVHHESGAAHLGEPVAHIDVGEGFRKACGVGGGCGAALKFFER